MRFKTDKLKGKIFPEVTAIEKEIDDLLIVTKKDLVALIMRSKNWVPTNKLIAVILTRFVASYRALLLAHNYNIIQNVINWNKGTMGAILKYNGLQEDYDKLNKHSTKVLGSFKGNFFTRKRWDNKKNIDQMLGVMINNVQNTIKNIYLVDKKEDTPIEDIAQNVGQYIKSDINETSVSPIDWFREKIKPVKKIVSEMMGIVPYDFKNILKEIEIRSGSLNYNAIRVARTESAITMRESYMDANEDMPWVQGWYWVLSSAHEVTDECDDLADGSPYENRSEIEGEGHPNCMCSIVADIDMGFIAGVAALAGLAIYELIPKDLQDDIEFDDSEL
jgi:hypothetical protein